MLIKKDCYVKVFCINLTVAKIKIKLSHTSLVFGRNETCNKLRRMPIALLPYCLH